MTELQIWVLITAGGILGTGIIVNLLRLMRHSGAKLGYKDWTVYIPESTRKADPTLDHRLQCLEEWLPTIGQLKKQMYLKLLKEHGVAAEYLVANEDFKDYQLCLNILLYSMNGLKSVQSIMQREISEKRYEKKRRDDEWGSYVETIIDRLLTVIDVNLNRDYDSQVVQADGSVRSRTISREELYEADHDPEHLIELKRIIEEILIGAREAGCTDRSFRRGDH